MLLVLRALAYLKFLNINLELKIIGDGPSRNKLENLIIGIEFIGSGTIYVGIYRIERSFLVFTIGLI